MIVLAIVGSDRVTVSLSLDCSPFSPYGSSSEDWGINLSASYSETDNSATAYDKFKNMFAIVHLSGATESTA